MTTPIAPPVRTTTLDAFWVHALDTWTEHLHAADKIQLAHIASDAEYLPPSPVADRMRAEVDAEQKSRAVTR